MGNEQVEALKAAAIGAGIIAQSAEIPGPDKDGDGRPELPWVMLPLDGRLASEFNSELGRLVSGRGLYRYKGKIVTLGVNEKTLQTEIREMTAHRLRDWCERECMVPYRYQFGKTGATKVRQTMAVEHASTCIESDSFCEHQPRLARVNRVRLPIMRRSGRIELLPAGYDAESCIYTIDPGWEYDEEMDRATALRILEDLVSEVPFQDDRARAVFFAAVFSQYCYFLMGLDAKRLNFLFHANTQGTGKTLLAQVVLTIAWLIASCDAMPDNAKDLKDRLDTAVREAMPYVMLDDIDRVYLRSSTLNSFMTANWWSGRKFHAQEQFVEPKTPVIFMTANNLEVTGDISRRMLVCDLFAPEADLAQRVIRRPIDATWVAEPVIHQQLCSALWALVKAWRDGDRAYRGRMVNGYEAWSALYGGIVLSAGFGDPCALRASDDFIDTEKADIHAVIERLSAGVERSHEYEFADIVEVMREINAFPHMIKGKMIKAKADGEDSFYFEATAETNSQVGLLLSRYGGRSFLTKDGRKIVFDKRGKNRHKRYLVQVVTAGQSPS